MLRYFVVLGCAFVAAVYSATFNNCRLMPYDRQLYHRRLQQEPTSHRAVRFLRYPEVLLDTDDIKTGKVITCIRCVDLSKRFKALEESECRIIAGGVGFNFVKMKIVSKAHSGYDYDVKIFGH